MKQVLLKQGRAFVDDVPAPGVEAGKVLVRVEHSAISVGTETHGIRTSAVPLWKRAVRKPHLLKRAYHFAKSNGVGKTRRLLEEKANAVQPLGYSAAGTVIETGSDVVDFQPGDRVACCGNQSAFHAEAICAPVNLTVSVPDNVDSADAATVALGAIALQGVRRLEPTLGETFVVVGLGFLGQLTAQILRAHGCRTIGIDVDRRRLELAEKLGLSYGLHPDDETDFEQVIRLTGGLGADGAIITAATSSHTVISHAFKMCRRKGRVVLVGDVGLNINRGDMYEKELDFRISTSYGPGRYDAKYEEQGMEYPAGYVRWTENRNMSAYLQLLARGDVRLQEMISAVVPVSQAENAYEQLKSGENRPLMVLLSYPRNEGTADSPVEHVEHAEHVEHVDSRIVRYAVSASAVGNQIGIAVVGPGAFARETHLPNLRELSDRFRLKAVVARKGHDAANVAQRNGAAIATTDFDTVLIDAEIEAVLITTRHNQHAMMTLQALRAGKHVLVEKPLALNEAELDLIAEFYRSHTGGNGKSPPLLLTGFNRRFAPAMGRIRSLIDKRSNPMIVNYVMNAGYIPSQHWVHAAEGGGRNLGEACHIYDLFTFLTGSRVESVSAHAIKPATAHFRSDDNFVATIAFEDGSLATLTYSAMGNSQTAKERMQIFVDGKVIELDDYRRLTVSGKLRKLASGRLLGRAPQKGHLQELQAFADVIQHGGDWPIPLWQQIQATEISFAVERQLRGD